MACGRSGSGRSSDGLSGSGRTNALAGNLIVVKSKGELPTIFVPFFFFACGGRCGSQGVVCLWTLREGTGQMTA